MGAPLEHPSSSSYQERTCAEHRDTCFLSKPGRSSFASTTLNYPITDDPSSRVGCEPSFPHTQLTTQIPDSSAASMGSRIPGCHVLCRGQGLSKPQIPIPQPALPHRGLGGGGWFRWVCQVLGPRSAGAASGRASGKGTKPWGAVLRLRVPRRSELGRTVAADPPGRRYTSWLHKEGGGGRSSLKNNLLQGGPPKRRAEAPLRKPASPGDPGARTRWREPGGQARC